MRKLKIGYVLDDTLDVMDGVQQAMVRIGKEFRARGHDVHYFVPATTRTDISHVHSLGDFVRLPFNGNSVRTPKPLSRRKLKDMSELAEVDVLHVQMPYSPFFAGRILQTAPQHVLRIGTFHILPYDTVASRGTALLGLLMRSSHRSLDKIFAVSEPALQFMQSSYGVSGSVLPNPVDYNFYNSFRKRQEPTRKKIVYVGRFDERKGVKEFVEAVRLLRNTWQGELDIVMCGKGPLLEWVSRYNDEHHLAIELPGFVDDTRKAQELASATIAVFPSKRGESFGIVLIEAMSAGAGVVLGGNNPGYASVMLPFPETLFDASSPTAIADTVMTFLQDDAKRQRIGEQQHDYVKQFDIEKVVDRLEATYLSLVAKQS